ncbi:MAG: hypothetical protein M3436_20805, partial [Pseudomonadota bacterium]|nr:hypothetical protein [Pseudomonadota bacterium]
IPGCSGGGGGGDCGAAIPAAVEQLGVSDEYLQSMQSLGMGESGMDMGAVNDYDSNAAAGTPSTGCWQMIPSTFEAYAQPDCMDINDPLCQAMSSIAYQEAVHGGPVWNPGYAEGGITSINNRPTLPIFRNGGVVPGRGGRLAMVDGGERVLTPRDSRTLEALVENPAARYVDRGAVAARGHDANAERPSAGRPIQINIGDIHVDGGALADPEEAAGKFKDALVDQLATLSREGFLSGARESSGIR